jgi:putative aminopeptidase FrvX
MSDSQEKPAGETPAEGGTPMGKKAAGGEETTVVPQLLLDLLVAHGPSGYEADPAAVWLAAAGAFATASTDVMGTPLALVSPKHGFDSEPKRLLVMGHIDEIGLIVTHIDDEGYLWFSPVGGWDAQILVGQRVALATREGVVRGVVGKKPIHLLREEERKKVAEIRELHIDIGAADGAQARARVRVGDVAVVDADPVQLLGGRLVSRALDNRIGSFVALEAARRVAEAGGGEWELAAVAVAQEEITFGGSRTSTFSLAPDAAIVIDVTHATDAPGIEVKELGKHELGSGPVVTRGSTIHPRLFELLYDTATEEGIPFTVEASARATGTDADAVHLARAGVPTALVSIPIRYMHSPVELVQLDDVHAAARLIASAALRLQANASFER